MATAYGPFLLTHGFRNHYVWSNADLAFWEPADSLNQYYLSTLLAYTGVRGNSFAEIMNYLTAAANSDGTHPDGTVYLLENSDVRSETRQPLFPVTLAELARRGRKGEVLHKGNDGQNGIIPIGKEDVIGAVVGSRGFQWQKANSRLLPGAIAESLTSYGGHFDQWQTDQADRVSSPGCSGIQWRRGRTVLFSGKISGAVDARLVCGWLLAGGVVLPECQVAVPADYCRRSTGPTLCQLRRHQAGITATDTSHGQAS